MRRQLRTLPRRPPRRRDLIDGVCRRRKSEVKLLKFIGEEPRFLEEALPFLIISPKKLLNFAEVAVKVVFDLFRVLCQQGGVVKSNWRHGREADLLSGGRRPDHQSSQDQDVWH